MTAAASTPVREATSELPSRSGPLRGPVVADLTGALAGPHASMMLSVHAHSPFMVETDKIERTRIVEDGGPKTGATVSKEVLRVSKDSLSPLQAALDYDVAQHLFIGGANLLVEGPATLYT